MKVIDCVQGSSEWIQARCGIPSASCFDQIITTKGEPSTQRKKYLLKLAGERLLGRPEETYQNAVMQRGIELEPEARELYEFITGQECLKTGFWFKDGYGASPDGVVAEKGVIEIKSPLLTTHIGYLLDKTLPVAYHQQVNGELLCTEREWCDFMSYYPGLPPFIIRVYPDDKFQKKLKVELALFVEELEEMVDKLRKG